MKERHSADIISLEHEDKLFNQGIFGDESPMHLLHTMIYLMRMHCSLMGGLKTIICVILVVILSSKSSVICMVLRCFYMRTL